MTASGAPAQGSPPGPLKARRARIDTYQQSVVYLREDSAVCRAEGLEAQAQVEVVVGDRAPFVIRKGQLGLMRPGTVMVDVAIDQGGCFETSRPTTHHQPTFEVDGIIHYCVTNMPGAVPVTSTNALANSTLPYVLAIAERGVAGAIHADAGLRLGVNVAAGVPTHPAVARSVGEECVDVEAALAAPVN